MNGTGKNIRIVSPEVKKLLDKITVLELRLNNFIGDLETYIMVNEAKWNNNSLGEYRNFIKFYLSEPKKQENEKTNIK